MSKSFFSLYSVRMFSRDPIYSILWCIGSTLEHSEYLTLDMGRKQSSVGWFVLGYMKMHL